MKHRLSFEIMVENSDLCYFIYFDTENYLAETIFRFEGVDADIRLEIIVESDPYRTILCRIPIDQREQFLNCIDLMPGMMEYVGRTDYADYCMEITSEFYRILMTEGEPLMKPDCNSIRLN